MQMPASCPLRRMKFVLPAALVIFLCACQDPKSPEPVLSGSFTFMNKQYSSMNVKTETTKVTVSEGVTKSTGVGGFSLEITLTNFSPDNAVARFQTVTPGLGGFVGFGTVTTAAGGNTINFTFPMSANGISYGNL